MPKEDKQVKKIEKLGLMSNYMEKRIKSFTLDEQKEIRKAPLSFMLDCMREKIDEIIGCLNKQNGN